MEDLSLSLALSLSLSLSLSQFLSLFLSLSLCLCFSLSFSLSLANHSCTSDIKPAQLRALAQQLLQPLHLHTHTEV